mgnify:CR=1 FL=1
MKKYILFILTVVLTFTVSAKKITKVSDLKGDFNSIHEIDFSNCGITDFPLDILKCKNLQKLNLSNNGFVKMPRQFGRLKALKELNLSHNQNISPFDLKLILDSAKFELEYLSLSNCALFFLPNSIAKQNKLIGLDVSENYIQRLPYEMMELNKFLESRNKYTGNE